METDTKILIIAAISVIAIILGIVAMFGVAPLASPAEAGGSHIAGGWVNTSKPTQNDWVMITSNLTNTWGWANGLILSNKTSTLYAVSANASINSTNVMTFTNGLAPQYNLTTTWTQIIPAAGQGLNISLPSAGTYLITGTIHENITSVGNFPTLPAYSMYGLGEGAAPALVANSERMGTQFSVSRPNVTHQTKHVVWIYSNSTAGSTWVSILGKGSSQASASTTGNWSIDSDATGRSTISYVKLT